MTFQSGKVFYYYEFLFAYTEINKIVKDGVPYEEIGARMTYYTVLMGTPMKQKKSVLGECGSCHNWMRCNTSRKEAQAISKEPCPDWQRLATQGTKSGWT